MSQKGAKLCIEVDRTRFQVVIIVYILILNTQNKVKKYLAIYLYIQDQLIHIEGVCIYGGPWRPKRSCCYRVKAFGYDSKHIREDK